MQSVKFVVVLIFAISFGYGLTLWIGMHVSPSSVPTQSARLRSRLDTETTDRGPLKELRGGTQPPANNAPVGAAEETEPKFDPRLSPVESLIRYSRPRDDEPDPDNLRTQIDRVAAEYARVARSPDANWTSDVEFQIERIYYNDKLATFPTRIAANECRAAGCNLQITLLGPFPDDITTKALSVAWPKFLFRVQSEVKVGTDDGVQGLGLINGSLFSTSSSNGSAPSIQFYWAAFDVRKKPAHGQLPSK